MRAFLKNIVSLLGAGVFLVCMGMLLSRPTNFASYLPEIVEVIEEQLEEQFEDPTVHIVLDAGHGGIDGGTTNKALLEKDLTLTVARMVRDRLKAEDLENIEIVMTREKDQWLSLHQRVALANKHAKCYFVSIHFNASHHRSASGTETFYADPKPSIILNQVRRQMKLAEDIPIEDGRGETFAEIMQRAMVSKLGTRDRGVRNNPNYVLPREVIGPSVLVECVFLSNPQEALKLYKRTYQEKVADGLTEGILEYVRLTNGDPFFGVKAIGAPPAEGEVSAESDAS